MCGRSSLHDLKVRSLKGFVVQKGSDGRKPKMLLLRTTAITRKKKKNDDDDDDDGEDGGPT